MIESTPAYKTSDGNVHATLADAKIAEIVIIMRRDDAELKGDESLTIATTIVRLEDEIAPVLGMKSRKPRTKVGRPKGSKNQPKTAAVSAP